MWCNTFELHCTFNVFIVRLKYRLLHGIILFIHGFVTWLFSHQFMVKNDYQDFSFSWESMLSGVCGFLLSLWWYNLFVNFFLDKEETSDITIVFIQCVDSPYHLFFHLTGLLSSFPWMLYPTCQIQSANEQIRMTTLMKRGRNIEIE